MLYGINYKSSEKHNKGYVINENLDVYFENPLSALKTAEELEIIADGAFNFSVFEKEKDTGAKKSNIANSFEQFNNEYFENVCDVLVQKLDDLWVYNQLTKFKKFFEGMPEKEQNDFLVDSGLKFKQKEEPREKE